MMIPKKIHYCWFGGSELPPKAQACIASWKTHCPDYEIVRWDESNSPLAACLYVRQAYEAKKWAFVSDYVRLHALCQQGGIYLDTDVELLGSLDPFLEQPAFLGFESPESVATCVMGACQEHPVFREIMALYETICFLKDDNSFDQTTNVARITTFLCEKGMRSDGSRQNVCGIGIYPADYFSPKSLETGKITLSGNSCAIHYFDASWMTSRQRFHTRLAQWLGPERTSWLKRHLGRE